MYEYKCKVRKVVDGDTVDIDIDLGFGIWLNDERVRIIGIDTPESRTSDDVEKIFGMAAKERVKDLLGADSTLISKVKGDGNEEMRGKFGRILGDFRLGDGDTLTSKLMAEGHAVAYNGGNKEAIADLHVANRQKLIDEGKVLPPEAMTKTPDQPNTFKATKPPKKAKKKKKHLILSKI